MCSNGKMRRHGFEALLTYASDNYPHSKEFFQSDEGIYMLVTDGVPIKEICNSISLVPATIEIICLRYINELDYKGREEGIKKLIQVKGLPRIDIIRAYINSKLNEKDFRRTYNIESDKWHRILNSFDYYDYVKTSIKEKEESLTRKCENSGRKVVLRRWM